MPLFGAHLSAAGEPKNALDEAARLGMRACQLFTKSNRQWQASPLSDEAIARFHQARVEHRIQSAGAHAAYLLNLATKDQALRRKSVAALLLEMRRAERLGLDYLVVHPGVASDNDVEAAVALAAQSVDEVHRSLGRTRVRLLLETTAGQGRGIGWRFEQLAAVLKQAKTRRRIGICLDTCHVFAAGYRLAPRRAYAETFRAFDDLIGLDRLRMFHLNDSLRPLGSRVDRHAHIGRGQLGLEPFALLVNDRRFQDHPMIMETPKGEANGRSWDAVNLETLRGLLN
jgi:deoxyribonuclease-4